MATELEQMLAKAEAILGQCIASADIAARAAAEIGGNFAPLASPHFTGVPTVPTPAFGDTSGQIINSAWMAAKFGQPNGVATLAGNGLIPTSQLPFAGLVAQGTWNANTNTPTLVSSTGTNGNFYVVTVAGTTNLDGINSWAAGDWALFGGGKWTKVPFVAPPISNLPLSSLAAQNDQTIVGNNTGSSAAPIALTMAQVNTMLPVMVGDSGSGGTKGLVPAPGAGDAAALKFLRADGTWHTVPGADLSAYALLASPAFTGTPTAPTAAVDTNSTQIATTAYVIGQASASGDGTPAMDGTAARGTAIHWARADHIHPTDTSLAPKASPTFTGTPAAPTAAVDTNTTQLATTAFVLAQASSSGDGTPAMDGTAARGTGTHFARNDHVHPTDTSRAPLASPTFTGVPAAPTAANGTNTTQIATCAYVLANGVSAFANPVQTYNSGTQSVTIPTGATKCYYELIGGGGGSSAADAPAGAGSQCQGLLTGLTPGLTLQVAIGAAGNGSGSNGGNTTLSSGTQSISTRTAGGGTGNTATGSSAAGGTATGGDDNIPGMPGMNFQLTTSCCAGGNVGGFGGGTMLGFGKYVTRNAISQPGGGYGWGGYQSSGGGGWARLRWFA